MSVAMERRESPWKGNGVAMGNAGWGGTMVGAREGRSQGQTKICGAGLRKEMSADRGGEGRVERASARNWIGESGSCRRLTEAGAGRKRGISDSEGLAETEAAGGGGGSAGDGGGDGVVHRKGSLRDEGGG